MLVTLRVDDKRLINAERMVKNFQWQRIEINDIYWWMCCQVTSSFLWNVASDTTLPSLCHVSSSNCTHCWTDRQLHDIMSNWLAVACAVHYSGLCVNSWGFYWLSLWITRHSFELTVRGLYWSVRIISAEGESYDKKNTLIDLFTIHDFVFVAHQMSLNSNVIIFHERYTMCIINSTRLLEKQFAW